MFYFSEVPKELDIDPETSSTKEILIGAEFLGLPSKHDFKKQAI